MDLKSFRLYDSQTGLWPRSGPRSQTFVQNAGFWSNLRIECFGTLLSWRYGVWSQNNIPDTPRTQNSQTVCPPARWIPTEMEDYLDLSWTTLTRILALKPLAFCRCHSESIPEILEMIWYLQLRGHRDQYSSGASWSLSSAAVGWTGINNAVAEDGWQCFPGRAFTILCLLSQLSTDTFECDYPRL